MAKVQTEGDRGEEQPLPAGIGKVLAVEGAQGAGRDFRTSVRGGRVLLYDAYLPGSSGPPGQRRCYEVRQPASLLCAAYLTVTSAPG